MTINGVSTVYTSVDLQALIAERARRPPQAANSSQESDAGSAGSAQPAASPPAATPSQFAASMMTDLLNSQQEIRLAHGRLSPGLDAHAPTDGAGVPRPTWTYDVHSVMVSSAEAPSPLQLDQIDPADAAQKIVDTVGKDGKVSLADVERALGQPNDSPTKEGSIAWTYVKDWDRLSGGADSMSVSDLTRAIKTLQKDNAAPAGQSDASGSGPITTTPETNAVPSTGSSTGAAALATPSPSVSAADLKAAIDAFQYKLEADTEAVQNARATPTNITI
jgi:hypothetical protein